MDTDNPMLGIEFNKNFNKRLQQEVELRIAKLLLPLLAAQSTQKYDT